MAVAILYPGSMGASLSQAIHTRSPDVELLTYVEGRSPETRKRAESAGLKPVSLEELVEKSRIIISVLPPSEAASLAQTIIGVYNKNGNPAKRPIYVDANAISPSTVYKVADIIHSAGLQFLDGSVIGGPASDSYDPKIYLSASKEDEDALKEVVDLLGSGKGLKLAVLEGGGIGAASALKMAYAGISKGTAGLITEMITSARAHSEATATALIAELADSQPARLKAALGLESMLPKAYRWVGEMEEISDFIANPTGKGEEKPSSSRAGIAQTYRGIARMYEKIADDMEKQDSGDDADLNSVDVLKKWIEQAKSSSKR